MPSLASFSDPKVYHILTYGTLLGSNLFQSFLAGPISFSCLPRAQFSTLQQKIFPPYFSFQTALPLVLALTWPGEKLARDVLRKDVGWRGVAEGGNMWTALLPIAIIFGTSLLNLVVLGPATTKVMRERKHQGMALQSLEYCLSSILWLIRQAETKDGKRYYEDGPKSAEMQRLNSSFSMLHGLSSSTNLIGLFAMLYYGVVLAEKL